MAQTKKQIDSWKQKKKYTLIAPESFGNQDIGVTIASDPTHLIGRTMHVSMRDLTEDKMKQHLNLVFEITGTAQNRAETKIKKFYINNKYLRSRIRSGIDLIEYVYDIELSDSNARIKIDFVFPKGIGHSQKAEIYKMVITSLKKLKENSFDDLIQLCIFGNLAKTLFQKIKKVYCAERVEIRMVKKMHKKDKHDEPAK